MSLVNVVGAQPAAWFSDKFGRKRAIFPAALMIATAAGCMPLCPSYELFMGLVALWACGSTLVGSTPTAFVADITSDDERSQALALLRSAGDVGLMVGASVLGAIADGISIEAGFAAASMGITACGVQFWYRAVESSGPAADPDRAVV